MDLAKWLDYLNKASILAVLALALYSGNAGTWVFGYQYRAMAAERDEWKAAALKALHVGESGRARPGVVGAAPVDRHATLEQVKARIDALGDARW